MSELKLSKTKWPTASLGDLCTIVIGRTPSRNRPDFWGGEHSWLSIADMNQGREIWTTKEKITQLGVSESGSRLIPIGTVLLSFKLSIGKVAVAHIDTYTNEAIAALPILNPEKLSRDFLFWTLRSIQLDEEVDVAAKGKTLNSKKLARLQIPLPPLDEQKRIAAVLDKADALRRQRQESLQLTAKLLQSVFIDMFGDPVRNPKGWPLVKSAELYQDKPRLGTMKPAKGSGNLVVRVGELGKEAVAFDRCGRVELKPEEIKRFTLLPGDTLLARAIGSKAQLGKSSYFDGHPETVVADSHVMRLRPDTEKCDPYWFYSLLATPFGRKLIQAKGGATAVQFNINGTQASDLDIPLPPRNLQSSFVELAKQLKEQAQDQEQFAEQAEKLFSSLQQRAFRGELDLSRLVLDALGDPPAVFKQKTN